MQKKPKVVLWSVLTAIMAIVLVVGIVLNVVANMYATTINVALGTNYFRVDGASDDVYFASEFSSDEERWANAEALCAELGQEGSTLLKNDNDALPLASGAKVSLFARGSVDLMYGGTGSGGVDTSSAQSLKDVLTARGVEVNETLWSWYTSESVFSKYGRQTPAAISDSLVANSQYGVNEAPWSEVEAGAGDSFADYGDAAIVVFARSGGEGADLPAGDIGAEMTYTKDGQEVAYTYGSSADGTDGNYLALSTQEQELLAGLKELKDAGVFKSIIVLLNTSNAIELDFLHPEICGVDYGIDSCMWIGDVGQSGIVGVAELLTGAASPSGSLVDTFLYDNLTNPAIHNFYSQKYTNADDYGLQCEDSADVQGMYSAYEEGIYLGYRYFETRYEDAVMGTGNAGDYDYTTTVAYPFGYGISYTTFEYSNYSVTENADSFTVNVTVTNTGDVASKKTVQVYFQSPFTDYDVANKIEKASIELCGFAKTDVLEPGASADVSIEVPKTELRSYDAYGAGTYILDAGSYYFTVANGAHEALNNVLAAKGYTTADGMDAEGNAGMTWEWTVESLDTEIFATSRATGNAITNLFSESDPTISSVAPDGDFTALSRTDWEGTYPHSPAVLTLTDATAADLAFIRYDASSYDGTALETYGSTLGADNGLNLSMLIGAEKDDERWYQLLDQLTFDEMNNMITLGFHNTAMARSIHKVATNDENGPQGFTASLTGGRSGTAFTSEDIMAATMNTELMYRVGAAIGEDCMAFGYSGLYGPGVNMHRTAYSGRNFEYYSEDPFVSGEICTAETQGIQSKGVYVYLKHVALNDSESSRRGVNTWLTEQAAREIYLEVADRAIIDGGAWCTMSGFNRWGTEWCGENYNLQTSYLRGELGMRGMSITDFSGSSQYMDVPDALLAGTDIWDSPMPMIHTTYVSENLTADENMIAEMKEAIHNICYTVVNSNAMNGWDEDTRIVDNIPWWQLAIYAVIAVGAVGTVVCAINLVGALKLKKSSTNRK